MYNIKFVYLFHENVSPALFAKIIRPSVAGQWIMSVPDHSLRSLFTRYDLLRTITGANPYQSGRDTRTLIAQDLEMGRVVAIDESFRDWSDGKGVHALWYEHFEQVPGENRVCTE